MNQSTKNPPFKPQRKVMGSISAAVYLFSLWATGWYAYVVYFKPCPTPAEGGCGYAAFWAFFFAIFTASWALAAAGTLTVLALPNRKIAPLAFYGALLLAIVPCIYLVVQFWEITRIAIS